MKTFIIAEAGVNHNGDLNIAKQLIDVAVDARADAIKFQAFKAEKLVSKTAVKAKYQTKNSDPGGSLIEMFKMLELSDAYHCELASYCKKKNIKFMSTPFDEESVDFLEKLGMKYFKIASGDITDKSLIQHIAQKRKPVILSTGMSYLADVEKAIGWINEVWDKSDLKRKLTLLHCVSSYPAKVKDSNLFAMRTMETAFGLPVGYSDHTMGIEIPIAAVALGAKVIEKHFTIDRDMEGPDHKASLGPHDLKSMVVAIRNVERALGDGIKKTKKCEEDTKNMARRSLVAARDIRRGETIDKRSIAIKRPGVGIPPEFIDKITNSTAKKNITEDTMFSWSDFN